MISGGKGGDSTKTGLMFEAKVNFTDVLRLTKGYTVVEDALKKTRTENSRIFFEGTEVARICRANGFYRFINEKYGIEWRDRISSQLLPDKSVFVIKANKIYIIECKTQKTAGSVDEKLQSCDFKKKQYKKLLAGTGVDIEYIYLLDEWFRHDKYKDVLDYIESVGCHYYFGKLPVSELGLPDPLT